MCLISIVYELVYKIQSGKQELSYEERNDGKKSFRQKVSERKVLDR